MNVSMQVYRAPRVNSRRHAHVFQHFRKPRVRAKLVQGGIDLDPDNGRVPLVTGLLQPLERLLFLAEGGVNPRDRKREAEAVRRTAAEKVLTPPI